MAIDFVELQAALKEGSIITDVHEKDNQIFFRVDGHLFATYSTSVYSETHPFFNSTPYKLFAARHNDPEIAEQYDKETEEWDKEYELWEKHKHIILKYLFEEYIKTYKKEGPLVALAVLEHFLDITTNGDHCKELIDKCEATIN